MKRTDADFRVTEWVERIVEVTGWRGEPDETGWEQAEARIGVRLPSDFKELARRFGDGSFYAFLALLRPVGDQDAGLAEGWEFLRQWAASPDHENFYHPYGIFDPDKGTGLIQWGSDQTGGTYFWIVDSSVDPAQWPTVFRNVGPDWCTFDMSTTELVYRVIADPEFRPFTVADAARRAFFLPAGQTISGAEEWDALTDPRRAR